MGAGTHMNEPIKDYFDAVAGGCRKRSASSIWAWQRNRETSAVSVLMGDISGERLLDLGCGAGHYTDHFLETGATHVTAVDFSDKMISRLTDRRVTGIVADATNVQLEEKFSRIVCAGLLEFAPAPDAVMRNARKFVSNDGRMICLVPPATWGGQIYQLFQKANGLQINLFIDDHFKSVCRDFNWVIDAKVHVFPYSDIYRVKPLVQ